MGWKFAFPFPRKQIPVSMCSRVTLDRCVTSPAPTYVRLVVFSCPCRDWPESRGKGNLAHPLTRLIRRWISSE